MNDLIFKDFYNNECKNEVDKMGFEVTNLIDGLDLTTN